MNFTADLVAEALYDLDPIKNKICRVYSASREDIFNVRINELPEWSIVFKMLFDRQEMDDFSRSNTTFLTNFIDSTPIETIRQGAKYQVEYYFSQTKYHKDDHLKKCEGPEGWILLSEIWNFGKMRRFHSRLSLQDLAEVMKLSVEVDVKTDIVDWGDGETET